MISITTNMNKVIEILLTFILVCWTTASTSTFCDSNLNKFDLDVAKLLTIGNSGRKFPENKGEDLKTYCRQSTNYLDDIEVYKERCLLESSKQSTGIMISSIREKIAQLCAKDSEEVNKIISAGPCANNGKDEINKCYTKLIDSFFGIKNAEYFQRIPMMCCEFYKLFPCIEKRLRRIKKCSETNVNTLLDFGRDVSRNLLNHYCIPRGYPEGSDSCTKLGAPPRKDNNRIRPQSFALPMIDVIESMHFRDFGLHRLQSK